VSSVNIVFTSVKAAAGMSLLDSGLVKHELGERAVAGLPSLLHAAAELSPAEFQLALPISLEYVDLELPPFHRAASIRLYAWKLRLTLSSHGFPKLEKLILSGCCVDFAALVQSCPRLRELRVIQASLDPVINIRSESLQKLFVRTNTNRIRGTTDCINVEAPMLKQLTMSFGTGSELGVSVRAPILEKVSWECSYDTHTAVLATWGLSKVHLYSAESLGQRMVTGAAGEETCLQLSNVNVLSLQILCCVWLMSCSILFNLTTKLDSCMI
jgi:hypothetical protein